MKVRLFIDVNLASGEIIELRKDHKHYVQNVLRCRSGREIFVFNPNDGEYKAIFKGEGQIEIVEQTIEPIRENGLSLIFAPIKFGKIDYMVQKATELGVTRIQPVQTRFTAITRINYDRLSANAIEAAEQTGRINFPHIDEIMSLEKLIESWDKKQKIIFCDESKTGKPIKQVLESMPKTAKDFAILIGPEGGFAKDEAEYLRGKKFVHPASMGKRLLRAETAAIAALGVFQAIKGDWN